MLPAPSWSIHLTDRGCSCCWRGWFTIIEIWMGWDTHEDLRNYRWSWEIHFDRVCLNEFDRTWFKVICFGFKNKGYKKTMHLENCHASSVFFCCQTLFYVSINQSTALDVFSIVSPVKKNRRFPQASLPRGRRAALYQKEYPYLG